MKHGMAKMHKQFYKLSGAQYATELHIDENTTFYGSKREEIIREKMALFNRQFDAVKLKILNS